MKRTIATLIAGISLSVAISSISAAPNLTDINGHWGKDQIEFAISQGFVDGYPDGTFKPDQNVSRVEFMKLVVDALKFKKNPLTQEWYQPYLDAGVANGLHMADEFPSDKLNDPISREEMARIAVRASGEANYDAKKWMYLATKKGIINGLDDTGTLGPDQPTTRAQAVTVIRRILKLREGASLPMDKYAISSAEVYWHKTNILTMLPRYFSKERANKPFRDDLMTYTSPDGNVACSVDQFIVVDMDDPNDPNHKLIPNDNLQWFNNENGEIKEVIGSNFAIVSQQTTHIKSNPKIPVSSCSTLIIDKLYDETVDLEKEGKPFKLAPMNKYYKSPEKGLEKKYQATIEGNPGDEITATTYGYSVLPKGDLISPNSTNILVRIGFSGINVNSPVIIYEGIIDKNISG